MRLGRDVQRWFRVRRVFARARTCGYRHALAQRASHRAALRQRSRRVHKLDPPSDSVCLHGKPQGARRHDWVASVGARSNVRTYFGPVLRATRAAKFIRGPPNPGSRPWSPESSGLKGSFAELCAESLGGFRDSRSGSRRRCRALAPSAGRPRRLGVKRLIYGICPQSATGDRPSSPGVPSRRSLAAASPLLRQFANLPICRLARSEVASPPWARFQHLGAGRIAEEPLQERPPASRSSPE
jgi:hypothetical protein